MLRLSGYFQHIIQHIMESEDLEAQVRRAVLDGKPDLAFRLSQLLLKSGRVAPDALLTYTASSIELGLAKRALQVLDELKPVGGDNEGKRHYALGELYDALGDPVAAKVHFRTALELNPYDFDARARIGLIDVSQGRFKDAIIAEEVLDSLNHDTPELHALRLRLVLVRKDAAAGRQLIRESLERSKESRKAYLLYLRDASWLAESGLLDPKSIALPAEKPTSLIEFKGWGVILMGQGRLGEASAALASAARLAPDDPWVWLHHARLAKRAQAWDNALAFYQKTLEVGPNFGPAIREIGLLLYKMHRKAEALPYVRRGWSIYRGRKDLFVVLFELELKPLDLLGLLVGRQRDREVLHRGLSLVREYRKIRKDQRPSNLLHKKAGLETPE